MTAVGILLERLDQADELETARAVAARHGLPDVGELLERRPGRSLEARALGDLYLALQARGHTYERIASLTGRSRSAVYQTIRARTDSDYRLRRNLQHKIEMARREGAP